MTSLAALIVLATLGQFGAQDPLRLAHGSVVEVCGRVTAFVSGRPATCDASLEVTTDGDPAATVVLPASIRRGSPGGRELQGADICATGIVEVAGNTTRVRVASLDDVRVVTEASTPAFGAGVADTCTTEGVVMPRVLFDVKPSYTVDAMRERAEGVVELEAIVDAAGNVSEVRVRRSLHDELDQQAVRALREWRFAPGTLNGVPTAVVVSIEMTFTLKPRR